MTRKEVLRGDQSLPAPALTVCPYFIKDVSAQVLKFVFWGNDINICKKDADNITSKYCGDAADVADCLMTERGGCPITYIFHQV